MTASTNPDSKFRWHEALTRAKLPDKAKLVGLTLWNYTSAEGRNAFPGNRRLANDLGISERTVIRSLALLREHGWITRTSTANRSGPRSLSDVYALAFPAERVTQACHSVEDERVTNDADHLTNEPVSDDTAVSHQQPSTSPKQQPATSVEVNLDAGREFDLWVKAYPRQEQKGRAKAAYAVARTKTDAAVLLKEAQAYRDQVTRQKTETQFIKMPANWLAKECWRDSEVISVRDWSGHERKMTRAEKAAMDAKDATEEAARTKVWW